MRIGQMNVLVVYFLAVALVLINPCYADSDYSGVDYSNPTPGYAIMAAGGAGVLASLLAVFLTNSKGDSPDVPSVPVTPVTPVIPVVAGKLSISLNQEPQDLHLGYRSIKIQNNSSSALTMDKVSVEIPSGLLNKIKYCSPSDATCRYKTDSNCTAGGTLDTGGSCRIWLKALNNDTDGLTTASGAIGVQVTADLSAYSQSFNVAYEKALYVGGSFTLAGGSSANNIAKWNGLVWSGIKGGVNGLVKALTVDGDGSLCVGGSFTLASDSTVSNLAKWDGASWSGIGGGVNDQVNALAVDTNGNLYAGGIFTSAGGNAVANIARWNGALWSDISGGTGGIVNALKVINGYLYVVGSFNWVGDSNSRVFVSGAARWQIHTSSWSGIGGSSEFYYYALSSYGEYVYLGGNHKQDLFYYAKLLDSSKISEDFSKAETGSGIFAVADAMDGGAYIGAKGSKMFLYENIAKWNGKNCYDSNECLESVGGGVDGAVRALVKEGSALYAGGDFTAAGSKSASRVALWNGVSWAALGDGLDGSVYALTTLASMKFLE